MVVAGQFSPTNDRGLKAAAGLRVCVLKCVSVLDVRRDGDLRQMLTAQRRSLTSLQGLGGAGGSATC